MAAAKHVLERRKRGLAAELKQRSAAAGAAEVAAMAAEARRLGAEAEAAALEAALRQRQLGLQSSLEAAAAHDSISAFTALLRQSRALGMPLAMLRSAQEALSRRQAAARAALAAAAAAGTLHAFLCARGSAVRCGVGLPELVAADRVLAGRRRGLASGLPEAVGRLCREAAPGGPAAGRELADVVAALGPALGLGNPEELLGRAVSEEPGSELPLAAADSAADATVTGAGAGAPKPQTSAAANGSDGRTGVGAYPAPFADTLPATPPAELAAGASSSSKSGSSGAGVGLQQRVRGAVGGVWSACVSALQLGAADSAAIALCALGLHARVQQADGELAGRRDQAEGGHEGHCGGCNCLDQGTVRCIAPTLRMGSCTLTLPVILHC